MSALRVLFQCRHILYATTLVEIRSRYTGTLFGLGWAILYPFLFLGLYAVVYGLILQIRLDRYAPLDYILIIFAGLIPFIGFSEALGTSVSSVSGNKQLIKNTLFPIELVPVKAVLAASLSMVIGLGGLILALWARGEFHVTQLLIVPLLVLQLVFSIGIGWLLSALNVFFRDVAQAIGIVVLFLMIASPIGYTRDMIPHALLAIAYINPLFYIIELYRQVLIYDQVSPTFWLAFITISVTTFWVGHDVFSRLKPVFAEYV
ncbi:MAG TPA: ABC transporter permease [Stellaceae bacterium]|jgi:lipopolysaccharide transport system permease protein|nr:ABC transporter permease [Stellaceae bacterium]